jgi:hypothetical protein
MLLAAAGCKDDGTGPETETPYSAVVRADAPVLYWRFEERSDTLANDSSGFARTGTYIASPLLGASVGTLRTGVGLGLQNDSDGVQALPAAWHDLETFTIEAWVRPSRVTTPEGMIVFDKGEVWNLLIDKDGRPAFQTPGGLPETLATGPVLADQTYHLVGTHTAGTMKLYVNGVLVSQAPARRPIEARGTPLYVGRGMTPERWEFYGVVDEVALYGTALSADAVLRHYGAGTP